MTIPAKNGDLVFCVLCFFPCKPPLTATDPLRSSNHLHPLPYAPTQILIPHNTPCDAFFRVGGSADCAKASACARLENGGKSVFSRLTYLKALKTLNRYGAMGVRLSTEFGGLILNSSQKVWFFVIWGEGGAVRGRAFFLQ
jgi:hypothetical protein